MRVFITFLPLLLFSSTLIVAEGRIQGRKNGNQKNVMSKVISQEERIDQLDATEQLFPFAAAPLSVSQYRQLVYPLDRNFTVFALFHNGDQEVDKDACPKCPSAIAMWNHLAHIHYTQEYWRKIKSFEDNNRKRCYFVLVKMYQEDNAKVYINISEPNLYFFGPNRRPGINRMMRFNIWQFTDDEDRPRLASLQDVIDWINGTSGIDVNTPRIEMENPKKTVAMYALGVSFICLYIVWRFGYSLVLMTWLMKKIQELNYGYWCVVMVIWCVSGQMFNAIRGTAWAYQDHDGTIYYISRQFSNQMLTESVLVFALYALMANGLIQFLQKTEEIQLKGKGAVTENTLIYYGSMFVAGFIGVLYLVGIKS